MHLGIYHLYPLVLYIGAIAAFLLSLLWKPEIGLYYLVPLLPMQTTRYWLHSYFLGEKLVDILLLGVLIGLFVRRERPVFVASPLNKILVTLFVLTYFSLWQGAFYLGGQLPISYLDPRFSDWKNYVEMMLLFFVAAAAIKTPRKMTILLVLMSLSVLQINRTYHNTVGDRDFSHFSYDLRDAGPLGYAGENGMGAFQAQTAVFFIGLAAFAKRRAVKLGLWGIAATCVYCLVLTFSRGGYLGFLTGLLVLGVVKERKLILLVAIILISWQSFVPGAVRERVLMTYQVGQGLDTSPQLDSSVGERVTLWQDALEVIHQNPAVGTGFDTYKYMGRTDYTDTHNYYVKVLLEMGILGLTMFVCLLSRASTISWRLFRQSRESFLSGLGCAVFAMCICAFIVNLFGDRWTFLQVNGFLWVLLGFTARGLLLEKQPAEELEKLALESRAEAEVSPA
jgi:putative inorganic carbon (HCO3(-)) transporter